MVEEEGEEGEDILRESILRRENLRREDQEPDEKIDNLKIFSILLLYIWTFIIKKDGCSQWVDYLVVSALMEKYLEMFG